jgi:hypothetical protein
MTPSISETPSATPLATSSIKETQSSTPIFTDSRQIYERGRGFWRIIRFAYVCFLLESSDGSLLW